ncbi:adenylosuccinate synthase [bacterium]|nr:adenylosuccinate synthase [bacterium]
MRKRPLPASTPDRGRTELIIGAQWGDEGKGKIVDLLGEKADLVARYQGGHNAGHTVKFGDETFILHLVPTGILRPDTTCVIGNGVVVDPSALLKETAELEARGIDIGGRIKISRYAHLIMPWHTLLESCLENSEGCAKIGTTGRGIGPAYADKIYRRGLRMEDLLDPRRMEKKAASLAGEHNRVLTRAFGAQGAMLEDILPVLYRFRERFAGCIVDTAGLLNSAIAAGKRVLIEGAQGALLDVDFGTYPFVTSSNTTIGGVSTGLGLSLRKVDTVIGIIKAYTTRVGNGPFPTELTGATGELLREAGYEYGATTGRPRRCGWFDGVAARYSMMLNDVDTLALTKLDVLDGLDEIRICTAYTVRGEQVNDWVDVCAFWDEAEPVYETMPGWKRPIGEVRRFTDLPAETQAYVKRLQEVAGVEFSWVSVGPKRSETIVM